MGIRDGEERTVARMEEARQAGGAEVFSGVACELGEGPHASPPLGRLFWFDILGRRLHEQGFDGGGARSHALPFMASAMATVDADRQLLAAEDGLYLREVADGRLTLHRPLEADRPDTRSNDARTHPSGAFWVSTIGRDAEPGRAAVYWYRAGELRRLYAGLTIPNAIAFSADGGTGYLADGGEGTIWRIPLDPATGLPSGDRRLFHRAGGDDGAPDGAVVDADGLLWNARYGAGRIDAFDGEGRRVRSVALPARQATCPAFAGADAGMLVATTAWQGMDAAARAAEPAAGMTFRLPFRVRGRFDPPVRIA
ncbi:SMP-30/gluconolactonase/LRE family protein [Coralloluteibacterium thermophilus]|uniref:SMP-30/gluconolactonase/LRE family protein n=1 Tax=Coralloluteibacterium thermophilum TaxID=2707049 RepID=A0ABV9NH19_9GAMM